jgi:hypothetical protein
VFLRYSSSYSVYFSFFTFFTFSRHIPGPGMCASHFPRFSVFSPYSSSYRVYFSFCMFFHSISPYSRSYHMRFSFSSFVNFLAIIQVLQYVCLMFHVVQFSCHIPGPTVYISNF